MRASISVVDEDEPAVVFEERAELYRLADGSHRIVARTDDSEHLLGIADVTVSRRQDDDPPVELRTTPAGIEIHNHRNHNPVAVVSIVSGRSREIDAGSTTTVDRDTVLELGHHTRVRVAREPDELTLDQPDSDGTADSQQPDSGDVEPALETAETAILDEIAADATVPANPEARSRAAIDTAETLVADCLPSGPAATALSKARTHHEDGAYERAIERATQVRGLAPHELAHLETVRQSGEADPTSLEDLRARSTRLDLDTDVVMAYERLPDTAVTGPLQGDHPPETVPTALDIDLAYDDIEKGDRLGTGGTADVFEATVSTPAGERLIALKEPRFDADIEDATAAFEREADTWERLDEQDNIVGVVDWSSDPHPWIAMEYMDRGPITGVAGRLSPRRAVWTLLGIVRGVYYAHRHGVAHLDIKPGNVLLRSTGPDTWPVPKVADWGLAKVLLEHTRSVEGYTPLYAAPEQVDPDTYGPTDTQTDIYQLGAVGYVLITGRPPFTGEAAAVVDQILDADVTPPSDHAPGLPAELDRIIATALQKDKSDRYETIVYLRDELENLLESL